MTREPGDRPVQLCLELPRGDGFRDAMHSL
jgi:hypothetical protein